MSGKAHQPVGSSLPAPPGSRLATPGSCHDPAPGIRWMRETDVPSASKGAATSAPATGGTVDEQDRRGICHGASPGCSSTRLRETTGPEVLS